MGLMTKMSKFDELKKKLQEKAKKNNFYDPQEIELVAGNTYKFRLLYFTNEKLHPNLDTSEGFVKQYVHGGRDTDNKYHRVTCPTTFFEKTGFDKCPCCSINSLLWNGSDEDKELYFKFRRRFNGYAAVYVIHDPVHPENKGHVRRLWFGVDMYRELKWRIYGIDERRKNDGENEDIDLEDVMVGQGAFDLDDGYDMILSVTKKGKFNNYNVDFARKSSKIDADPAVLEAELNELKLGEDIKPETDEALEAYFNAVMLGEVAHAIKEGSDEVTDVMDETTSTDGTDTSAVDADVQNIIDEVNGDTTPTEEAKPEPTAEEPKVEEKAEEPKPEPKAEASAEESKEESTAAPAPTDDGGSDDVEEDISSLLSEIEAEINGK